MRRILLVEDEKIIRYGIYVMIENSGIPYEEIAESRNGKEAVEHFQKDAYDLILTDIKMPIMDGLALTKWVWENIEPDERPLIVAISGYAEFEYVKGMMKLHAIDYLLKPVDREELKKVLWHAEEILRNAGRTEPLKESNAAMTGINRHKLQKALDYIRKNYENPIDMAEVSNYIDMNYSTFSVAFKEYTGENFSSFLRKYRVDKSKKLLTNTDMGISDISKKVGFVDARRFAKVFKEEIGMTPTAFRDEFTGKK